MIIDISSLDETQKSKLRGAIKFFNGDKNNINVAVKVNQEIRPCGQIHLTEEILKLFEEIVGERNAIVQ